MSQVASGEAIQLSLRQYFNQRSGVHKFHERLQRGEPSTVAFFGASQTAIPGWAQKTFAFLQSRTPEVPLKYENPSQGGVDLLVANRFVTTKLVPLQPHLLFLEFTPSSLSTDAGRAGSLMEQLVCTLFEELPDTDICYVHCPDRPVMDARLQGGDYPEHVQIIEQLLDYYDVASVNFIEHVVSKIQNNEIIFDRQHYNELRETLSREEIAKRIHYSVEGHPLSETGAEILLDVMKQALPEIIDHARPRTETSRPRLMPPAPDAKLEEIMGLFSRDTRWISDIGYAEGHLPDFLDFRRLLRIDLAGCVIDNTELSFAGAPSLELLRLQFCNLHVPFPDFRNNTRLLELGVTWNRIYGRVPSFAENPNLSLIAIGHNELTELPERFELPRLTYFSASRNRFRGTVPDFSGCTSLELLALDENEFSGPLPNLQGLPIKNLLLHGCRFTTYEPGSFWIPSLVSLVIGYNPLEAEAVVAILQDLVALTDEGDCMPKRVDLSDCLSGDDREVELIQILEKRGWTVVRLPE